jgi:hypothetical protein
MPAEQLALRGVVAAAGLLALLIASGSQLVAAGLVALVGVPAALTAAVRPDGSGPTGVLAAAAGAWALRYGVAAAPLRPALALAVLLYLHHVTAALCAAVPPAAAIDRAVLLRWGAHVAGVLGCTVAAAGGLRLLGRPAASSPLELVGIAAAVALAGLLVLLARAGGRNPAQ